MSALAFRKVDNSAGADICLEEGCNRSGRFAVLINGLPILSPSKLAFYPHARICEKHRRARVRQPEGRRKGDRPAPAESRPPQERGTGHIFRQVNDSRSINHAEKFLHRVGQKEPKALEMLALMEQEGFAPTTSPGGTANAIYSTGSLEWVWDGGDAFLKKRRGSGPHRDAVAHALSAYRALVPGPFTQQSALLKGLGAFFLRYPEADYDRLLEKLQGQYPNVQKLLGASKQAKQDFHLPNNYAAFGFIARLTYNGGRRVGGKNTLPEWRA